MKKLTTSFCLILIIVQVSHSQTLKIDLGEYETNETHSLNYESSLINDILLESINPTGKLKYEITYEIEKVELEPIDYDLTGYAGAGSSENECDNLSQLIKKANTYADNTNDFNEKEWKKDHLEKIREEMKKGDCSDKSLLKKANSFLKDSEYHILLDNPIKIKKGEQLILYVRRGQDAKVYWKFIIKGDPLGKWFVHYGFGFASPLKNRGTYFSQSVPDTSLYMITKKEDRGFSMQYLPSVLFSFIPYKNYNKNFFGSLTGGVGANTDDIAVIFGGSLFFWQNLGINLHIIGKNQHVLDGKYKEDGTSTITENLDFDQLHEEKFKLHWGVSISYRFGSNPFVSNDNSEQN